MITVKGIIITAVLVMSSSLKKTFMKVLRMKYCVEIVSMKDKLLLCKMRWSD